MVYSRWFFSFLLFSFLCFASFVSYISAEKKDPNHVVAVVNGEPIFHVELERQYEQFAQLNANRENLSGREASIKQEVLERLVENKLIIQEAENKNYRVSPIELANGLKQSKQSLRIGKGGLRLSDDEVEAELEQQLSLLNISKDEFTEQIRNQILQQKFIRDEIVKNIDQVAESQIKDTFEEIKKVISGVSFSTTDPRLSRLVLFCKRVQAKQVNVRHILIRNDPSMSSKIQKDNRTKAEDLLRKLKDGEDFSYLAKRFSEDLSTKSKGGELGFISTGDIPFANIEEYVFNSDAGDISDVIKTPIGFYIFKIVEIKKAHPLDYVDVYGDIENFLIQVNIADETRQYVTRLRSKANIKLNPTSDN